MRPQGRMLLAIIFGLPLLIATPIALIGSVFFQPGRVQVSVVSKSVDGSSVAVAIPAAILPLAARLGRACSAHCGDFDATDRAALEVAEAALAAMAESPDGVYVDVRTRDETVVISKREGVLQIDIDTPDEVVHATVPLSAARSILSVI